MKVAFYVPPIPDGNTTPVIGPLSLIAVLEKNGFDCFLFDGRIDAAALSKLISFGPDIVGISAVTPAYLNGLRAAVSIKAAFPDCVVVFGGPHPSSLPKEVVAEHSVDCVLVGECEKAIVNLFDRIRRKSTSVASLSEVPNLVFKNLDEIIVNSVNSFLSDKELDDLPRPAFDKMDLKTYFAGTQTHGLFQRGKRILPVMATRGCPNNCTYCCRMMGKKIRCRSVDSVISEVRFLVDTYNIDELYFEDDNFTFQRERALEILERLAAFKPQIYAKFANGLRVDRIDKEILAAMKKANVYSLSFGIESGCEKTLNKMKKRLNLDIARENVMLAKSMGFLVGANCIIGYPGETVTDIEESFRFFFGLPLDSMAIVNLVPFPGTEVRAFCEQEGYLTEESKNWDNYFFSINKPIPLIETPVLSKEQLTKMIKKAYFKMYLQPSWIFRTLRHLSFRQIFAGARVMFRTF